MCRPNIVAKATDPFLEIHAGRHPCVIQTFTGSEYIPNDTLINVSQVNDIVMMLMSLLHYSIIVVLLSRAQTWEASQLL